MYTCLSGYPVVGGYTVNYVTPSVSSSSGISSMEEIVL